MNITGFGVMPKNAICTEILTSTVPFPSKVGPFAASLRDYVAWLQTGRIVPYINNRGGTTKYKKDVSQKFASVAGGTVKSIINDFKPQSFGEVRLALMSNGTLQNTTAHSRTAGLMQLYWKGGLSTEDLDTQINFMIVSEDYKMDDYIITGQQTGHSTAQKVHNEDLAY